MDGGQHGGTHRDDALLLALAVGDQDWRVGPVEDVVPAQAGDLGAPKPGVGRQHQPHAQPVVRRVVDRLLDVVLADRPGQHPRQLRVRQSPGRIDLEVPEVPRTRRRSCGRG